MVLKVLFLMFLMAFLMKHLDRHGVGSGKGFEIEGEVEGYEITRLEAKVMELKVEKYEELL